MGEERKGVTLRGWQIILGYWLPGVALGWGLGTLTTLLMHWRLGR